MLNIEEYTLPSGISPYQQWFENVADLRAAARIYMRIKRMEAGNMGDCKPIHDGVWELRIDVGQGYRVYYAKTGKTIILLLCGGDKNSQKKDIERAVIYLNDYKKRAIYG